MQAAADRENHKGVWGNDMGMVKNEEVTMQQKNESVKPQLWVEGCNSNGICDKVTFREISTPSPLNEKALS